MTKFDQLAWLRDRSLFMTGRGGRSQMTLRKILSRTTRRACEKFRGPLDMADLRDRSLFMAGGTESKVGAWGGGAANVF